MAFFANTKYLKFYRYKNSVILGRFIFIE